MGETRTAVFVVRAINKKLILTGSLINKCYLIRTGKEYEVHGLSY